jgi:hypothetical protein
VQWWRRWWCFVAWISASRPPFVGTVRCILLALTDFLLQFAPRLVPGRVPRPLGQRPQRGDAELTPPPAHGQPGIQARVRGRQPVALGLLRALSSTLVDFGLLEHATVRARVLGVVDGQVIVVLVLALLLQRLYPVEWGRHRRLGLPPAPHCRVPLRAAKCDGGQKEHVLVGWQLGDLEMPQETPTKKQQRYLIGRPALSLTNKERVEQGKRRRATHEGGRVHTRRLGRVRGRPEQ